MKRRLHCATLLGGVLAALCVLLAACGSTTVVTKTVAEFPPLAAAPSASAKETATTTQTVAVPANQPATTTPQASAATTPQVSSAAPTAVAVRHGPPWLSMARGRKAIAQYSIPSDHISDCARTAVNIVECGITSLSNPPGGCEMFVDARQPTYQEQVETKRGATFCWSTPNKNDSLQEMNNGAGNGWVTRPGAP